MNHRDEFIMSPKIDFCFKELMTNEEIRRGFISAVLGIQPEEIVETQLMPTLLRKEKQNDKQGILDVRVKINNREQINMEIQIVSLDYWAERSLFYLSKMYTEQIQGGEAYSVIQKCIHVGILDFLLFPESEDFYSCFHFWEDGRREKYSEKMEIHVLELPKLHKFQYPETELLKWARFLNAERKEEFEKMAKENPYIGIALEELEKLSADEIKRLEYESTQKLSGMKRQGWITVTRKDIGKAWSREYSKGLNREYSKEYSKEYNKEYNKEYGLLLKFFKMYV